MFLLYFVDVTLCFIFEFIFLLKCTAFHQLKGSVQQYVYSTKHVSLKYFAQFHIIIDPCYILEFSSSQCDHTYILVWPLATPYINYQCINIQCPFSKNVNLTHCCTAPFNCQLYHLYGIGNIIDNQTFKENNYISFEFHY